MDYRSLGAAALDRVFQLGTGAAARGDREAGVQASRWLIQQLREARPDPQADKGLYVLLHRVLDYHDQREGQAGGHCRLCLR